ncbi:MAG: hypothetical protein ACK4U0_13985, partial [Mesorhizobium sp.]
AGCGAVPAPGAPPGVAARARPPPMPVAGLKAAQGVQPGDCKRTYSVAMGQNPAMAQAIWVGNVSAQYGAKWAHWVGAKNKAIVQHGSGAGAQFEARAMPCFYQPVP